MSFHQYSGTGSGKLPPFQLNSKLNDPSLYIPSKGLVNAVNVALTLGQPLLLTGEPGTGKTQLAYHIALYFGLGKPEVFNAQTTSTASDLFYRYDTLGHFQYSQNSQNKALTPEEVEERFIIYQGLGAAILSKERKVVLIDEIDKAPRDLPNDILAAVEDLKFKVAEVGAAYETTAENRPIIIITSNSEKNLPDAFLRRVVYFHIPFPDEEMLLTILSAKTEGFADQHLKQIVAHFGQLRSDRNLKLKKKPATAELISWSMLLKQLGFDTSKLANAKNLEDSDKERLLTSYSVLAKTKEDLATMEQSLFGRKR